MDPIIIAELIGATATIVGAVITIHAQRKSIFNPVDQDALKSLGLGLAQGKKEKERYNGIRSRFLFTAFVRLKPEPLAELFELLPEGALPEPASEDLTAERFLWAKNPQLSWCVKESLVHLSKQATPRRKISSVDIFVDIAKYGNGKSVKRLREHGVTPDKIQQYVKQLGLSIIERDVSTFGSRIYEKVKEIKDAEELLKIEFILDEINSDEFRKKMKELREKTINIENIMVNSTKEKVTIAVRNIGSEEVTVDRVYVTKDNIVIPTKEDEVTKKIEPKTAKKLAVSFAKQLQKGTYKIKVATTEGITDEKEYTIWG